MDSIEHGAKLYNQIRDAYIEAAAVCLTLDTKDKRDEFKTAFGRSPKDIVKAVHRFPEVFLIENDPDLFSILGAIALSKVKDDDTADELWRKFQDNKSFEDLRDAIKELATPRAPKVCKCNHPNNARCNEK
jgi:hypothetical protein